MIITRREGPFSVPVTTKTVRPAGTRRARGAEGGESSFDQITLSARAGQEASPTFRSLAASLSQQVRTCTTTGKIQDLHSQVASGEYRPDARETAARMLLWEVD